MIGAYLDDIHFHKERKSYKMDQGIHFIMKKKGTVKQCNPLQASITLRGSTPCLRCSFVFPQSVLILTCQLSVSLESLSCALYFDSRPKHSESDMWVQLFVIRSGQFM